VFLPRAARQRQLKQIQQTSAAAQAAAAENGVTVGAWKGSFRLPVGSGTFWTERREAAGRRESAAGINPRSLR